MHNGSEWDPYIPYHPRLFPLFFIFYPVYSIYMCLYLTCGIGGDIRSGLGSERAVRNGAAASMTWTRGWLGAIVHLSRILEAAMRFPAQPLRLYVRCRNAKLYLQAR